MSKETHLRAVLECGVVAIVRSPDSQQLVEVCRALADGGVTTVEIKSGYGLDVDERLRNLRSVHVDAGSTN